MRSLASVGQTVAASTDRDTGLRKVVVLAVTHDPMKSI